MSGHNMELKQVAEWNVARLGLIPAQSKLPEKYRMGWEEIKGDGENMSSVRATTGEACGIPYGLAGDVMAALMTLAVTNADKNIDGKVRTTLDELCKMMLIKHTNGHYYKEIVSALDSLSSTAYTVEQRWRTPIHKKRTFVRFLLINKFGIEETIAINGSSGVVKHIYAIDLNELLWQSASGGLTLALDPELLSTLESPTSRAIYRMLESYRRSEDNSEQIAEQLTIRAVDFADAARLLSSGKAISDRLTSLTRKKGTFEQLQREHYLKSVDIVGRGDATILQFRFADTDGRNVINTHAERLLIEAGVQPSYALKLAEQHSSEAVECALWITDQIIKKQKGSRSEVKNPAGFIIKLLTTGDALKQIDIFRTNRQKQLYLQERLTSTAEALPPVIPEKTSAEQLIEVIKLKSKKLKDSTISALREAVTSEKLTAQQIKSLLFTADPEKLALELLSPRSE